MFSTAERDIIFDVKVALRTKIAQMQQNPWASGYVLPWRHVFLSGGAIASLLQGNKPKDWDFYFTQDSAMRDMESHLLKHKEHIQDIQPNYMDMYGQNGKMITANAITMKDGSSFVTMTTGEPNEIKASFDYVHCTPHYSVLEDKLYISPKQYHAIVGKKLVVNNPLRVKEYRRQKFLQRGYTE